MDTILIVEDDEALNDGIAIGLGQREYRFIQTYTMAEGKAAMDEGGFDLCILDVNLPDGSGFDLCRHLRATSELPVVFLTANDMETDIVRGFEFGGDDYITKPFSLMVLRARIGALLRRAKSGGGRLASVYENHGYSFDFEAMDFRKNGQKIELSKTEQKLLKLLIANEGNAVPRDLLVDRIWTDGAEYVDENALSVTVKRLRAKLEDKPQKPQFIRTVYGIGYRWEAGEHE
ncbi:MAG: response regulator transcription factor [Bacillota bacterium]|nr:response regulator transcription factor [Bacillota bacterium]